MPDWLRHSVLFRALATFALVLLLQIPIALIASTVQERRATRDQAFEEVTRTWGGSQELAGPALVISYDAPWTDEKGKTHERTAQLTVFPRRLTVKGRADTEVRRRGIFDVPLYVAQLHVEAGFVVPRTVPQSQWRGAALALGISDPRAIRACTTATGQAPWEPSAGEFQGGGLHAPVTVKPGDALEIAFDLTLAGSSRLSIVPVGDETTVSLASPWPDPAFDGAWLPAERSVSPAGFEATWKVLGLARNFPSVWSGPPDRARLSAASFGVSLLSPVDTYRTNDRAVKYQLLFLGLTFLCFTLFELLAGLRVHPVQYLFVGLALCLFYLLLLSLSEQVGFEIAYGAAAVATVALVTVYVSSVLGKGTRGLAVGGFLGSLYAFLFVLLRIQDYALLVGSAGLFTILAGAMWITRRVDWYRLSVPPARDAIEV